MTGVGGYWTNTLHNTILINRWQMKELIGKGRTADVYRYDDNKAVKIFHRDFTHLANEEYIKVKNIDSVGIHAPHVYELIEINSQKAIIYEFVHGNNLIYEMQKQPLKVNHYSKKLAESHAKIHSKSVSGLQSVKESLCSEIINVQSLKQTDKEKIMKYIASLSDGNSLCHYDFHPGNILVSNDKFNVIDWMTAVTGNPCADVCRTGII